MFFWLPYYLNSELNYPSNESALLSTVYDIGSAIGGIAGGLLSDKTGGGKGGRALIMLPAIVMSVPLLLLFREKASVGLAANISMMLFLGVTIGGPGNLFPSAVVADLGSGGEKKAMATIAGIVDGSGSLGAAIGQISVALIARSFGWNAVFYGFIGALSLSGLCMLHLFVKDARGLMSRCKKSEGN